MQYILSEEEYKALMPRKEYEQIRNSLLEENAELEIGRASCRERV